MAQTPNAQPRPDTKSAEIRLKALSEELRCLVCQNQTLADSNADLAVDLRNQVKSLIDQGQSDSQIKTYLVERYGDFVLYKPPMQANTWLLWLGPFVLLIFGALIWRRVQRTSERSAVSASSALASAAPPSNGAAPSPAGQSDSRAFAESTDRALSARQEAARKLLD